MAAQETVEPAEEAKPLRRTLNLPDEVNKAADARARMVRRSFNNYVEWLIAKDCGLAIEDSFVPASVHPNPDGSATARI